MIKKSHAKVNIFLKIAGKRDNYHELVSRFVQVQNLYDEIEFVSQSSESFTLLGDFGCSLEKNTIYKAYEKLKSINPSVENYFKSHIIKVTKNIPEFAGLGGGSSNAATFLLMTNEVCNLNLSLQKLIDIGVSIGADVPFFLTQYKSANVTGIGEIIEEYDEELLEIETITPAVKCNTGAIFTNFRDEFYKEISIEKAQEYQNMSSRDFLAKHDIFEANDLYASALKEYNELSAYQKNNWYFSGSGSTFFRVVN